MFLLQGVVRQRTSSARAVKQKVAGLNEGLAVTNYLFAIPIHFVAASGICGDVSIDEESKFGKSELVSLLRRSRLPFPYPHPQLQQQLLPSMISQILGSAQTSPAKIFHDPGL
jgi:hypothetical protein